MRFLFLIQFSFTVMSPTDVTKNVIVFHRIIVETCESFVFGAFINTNLHFSNRSVGYSLKIDMKIWIDSYNFTWNTNPFFIKRIKSKYHLMMSIVWYHSDFFCLNKKHKYVSIYHSSIFIMSIWHIWDTLLRCAVRNVLTLSNAIVWFLN